MNTNAFALRHIGPRENDIKEMLQTIGAESIEQLIYETIPSNIRLEKDLGLDAALVCFFATFFATENAMI